MLDKYLFKFIRKKTFKRVIIGIFVLLIVYWLPFGVTSMNSRSSIFHDISNLPNSDAVIVFGTLVNESGDVSPLLKERLEAGKAILEAGKSEKIVVSNTQAYKTPDTCEYEKKSHPEDRKLIFVSQGFHLPRLIYQCNQLNVNGVAFRAESLSTIDRSKYSWLTKFKVRTSRYTREAGLMWFALLNAY